MRRVTALLLMVLGLVCLASTGVNAPGTMLLVDGHRAPCIRSTPNALFACDINILCRGRRARAEYV